MNIFIVIVLAAGALMFFRALDAIADWGGEHTRRQARFARKVRNFFVLLIAIALIALFAAANS